MTTCPIRHGNATLSLSQVIVIRDMKLNFELRIVIREQVNHISFALSFNERPGKDMADFVEAAASLLKHNAGALSKSTSKNIT